MNNYTPNFSDKRTIKRIKSAIGFARTHFSPRKPREMSTRYIDKYFGVSSNPLSRYLRDKLLTTIDSHFFIGSSNHSAKCKQYTLNSENLRWLQEQIGIKPAETKKQDVNQGIDWLNETFKTELTTKDFKYTEKSHRLYSNLQTVKSEYRKPLFAINGMQHDYDIRSASATILYQLHKKVPPIKGPRGGHIAGYDGKPRIFIKTYIHNKKVIRQQLAKDVNIEVDEAKSVFAAILNKARLNAHPSSAIMQELMNGRKRSYASAEAVVKALIAHPFLTQFRKEVNEMWGILLDLIPDRNYKYKGKNKKAKIHKSDRYDIYFQEERKILESVKTYCASNGIKVFGIHDGWVTTHALDLKQVEQHIYKETAYDIKIDYEYVEWYE